MRFSFVNAAAIVLACSLVSACGTSEYCQSIDADQQAFNDAPRTAEGFRVTASLLREWSKLAPEDLREDYHKVAANMERVARVQEDLGVSIQDMSVNPDKIKELSTAQRKTLEDVYAEFNALAESRIAVDTNIKQECEITLK